MTFSAPSGPERPRGFGGFGEPETPGYGPPPGSLGLPPQPGAFPPPTPPLPGQGQHPTGPPDWRQLPPEHLAHLQQPGIVPLRPLTMGDMFNGSLQTMRRNPGATIGMGLIVLAIFLVPSLLLSLGINNLVGVAVDDKVALSTLVNLVFSGLASIALTGMIVYVVSEAVLGDRVDLAETWKAVRGRLPALVGAVLLIAVIYLGIVIGFVLLLAALFVAGDQGMAVPAVILSIVAMLGLFVLLLWVGCRLSLTPAPVVLEKAGPWRAIGRVWSLTKGAQAWRIVGITMLAAVVTSLFTGLVQIPVTGVLFFALDGMVGGLDSTHPLLTVTDHLVQLVVQAFVIPFTAGLTALLYLDQRIRREGLDITLFRAAQARAAQPQR